MLPLTSQPHALQGDKSLHQTSGCPLHGAPLVSWSWRCAAAKLLRLRQEWTKAKQALTQKVMRSLQIPQLWRITVVLEQRANDQARCLAVLAEAPGDFSVKGLQMHNCSGLFPKLKTGWRRYEACTPPCSPVRSWVSGSCAISPGHKLRGSKLGGGLEMPIFDMLISFYPGPLTTSTMLGSEPPRIRKLRSEPNASRMGSRCTHACSCRAHTSSFRNRKKRGSAGSMMLPRLVFHFTMPKARLWTKPRNLPGTLNP